MLRKLGAKLTTIRLPPHADWDACCRVLLYAEAYAIHRRWSARSADYDPRVAKRVVLGKDIAGWEYVELGLMREAYMKEIGALMAPFDAFLIPSTPCVAPTIVEADANDPAYFRWNLRILRNAGLANFLDGCAATLPCHAPGEAPVVLRRTFRFRCCCRSAAHCS